MKQLHTTTLCLTELEVQKGESEIVISAIE